MAEMLAGHVATRFLAMLRATQFTYLGAQAKQRKTSLKALILILVLAAIIWYFAARGKRRKPPAAPVQKPAEQMVVCAHCRLNLPAGEALVQGTEFYCCEEHRRLGAR